MSPLIGSFASAALLITQAATYTGQDSGQQVACCSAAPVKQNIVVKKKTPVAAASDSACCAAAAPARVVASDDSPADTACASGLRLKMFVTEFEQPPIESARSQLAKAVESMKGVYRASASEDGRLLTVLAEVDGEVTAERVVKYLELAGYKSAEASKADYDAEIVRQGGIRAGTAANEETEKTQAPDLLSLDDSLKPLIDAFNADRGKLRFVAILSPT